MSEAYFQEPSNYNHWIRYAVKADDVFDDELDDEYEFEGQQPYVVAKLNFILHLLEDQDPMGLRANAAAASPEPDPNRIVDSITWLDENRTPIFKISGLSKTFAEMKAGLTASDRNVSYAFLVSLMDGTNTISGSGGRDIIEVGATGTATVNAGGGDDVTYVWHQKNIVLDGGSGTDSIHFSAFRGSTPTPTNGLTVDLSDVTGTNGTNPYGGTLTLRNVENVTGTGKNDVIKGNGADNKLGALFLNGAFEGIGGSDSIRGEGGNDTIGFTPSVGGFTPGPGGRVVLADGGTGYDFLSVDLFLAGSGTHHILDLNARANNTGVFASSTVSNFEKYQVGDYTDRGIEPQASFEFRGTGVSEDVVAGWGADTLLGNGGNDHLTGLDGIDTLNGGAGNDTLDSSAASKGGFSQPSLAGADRLDGGADTDLAIIHRGYATTGLTLSIANPNAAQTLSDGTTVIRVERLDFLGGSGSDKVTGGALYDVLDGGAGVDTLNGGGSTDTLDGGSGADQLTGGLGDDTYRVDNAADKTIEAAGGGADRVFASVSYALAAGQEIETLATAYNGGTLATNLTGNEGVQTIFGNAGVNRLDGRGGADTMSGLGGNDIYTVDNAGDRVVEAAGGGSDRVNTSTSYTLGAEQSIEVLSTTNGNSTANLNLTGNELAQAVYGSAGANRLDGKGGADTLSGLGGNDIYTVDNAGDRVFEAANGGSDRVNASASYTLGAGQSIEVLSTTNGAGTATLHLTGNELAQTVYGNAGVNRLDGRGGADTLTGYAGKDIFVFTTSPTSNDHITDFSVVDDTIQLSKGIFTVLPTGSLSSAAFKDLGVAGATIDSSDRILYNHNTGVLSYDADGSGGASAARQFAILDNHATLTNADFLVA